MRNAETSAGELAARFIRIRSTTEALSAPLSEEDSVVQSMPDASPVKWHLAHTSWFFETFVLAKTADFKPFHPSFGFLFNSYYDAVGARHPRPERGLLTRPSLSEVKAYRKSVDERMSALLENRPQDFAELFAIVELGLHHEQQHQELLLTDVKHLFGSNPLRPAYHSRELLRAPAAAPLEWQQFEAGLCSIGHGGGGFAFDNEGPQHRAFVEAYALANRLVTNAEYLEFIVDGGYRRPELWFSEGFRVSGERGWTAPLYWEIEDERVYTLAGLEPIAMGDPVSHVSYYEADAFARWAGGRLATEAEWERAALGLPIAGNFLESGALKPCAASAQGARAPRARQMFGDVWEWTSSAYSAYPGYRPTVGALGEYNAKFMCNQLVLRGGSCATPETHIRPTYRNFFPADARWQFSGIRLARSA
jgi:ergothioneine biosynthesis protein EgtB